MAKQSPHWRKLCLQGQKEMDSTKLAEITQRIIEAIDRELEKPKVARTVIKVKRTQIHSTKS